MAGTLDLSGFKLTYDDEFNSFSSSPDGSTGQYKTSFYFGGRSLPSNGEHEFYSDSSVGTNPFSLHNGALDITAAPGDSGGPVYDDETGEVLGILVSGMILPMRGTFPYSYMVGGPRDLPHHGARVI